MDQARGPDLSSSTIWKLKTKTKHQPPVDKTPMSSDFQIPEPHFSPQRGVVVFGSLRTVAQIQRMDYNSTQYINPLMQVGNCKSSIRLTCYSILVTRRIRENPRIRNPRKLAHIQWMRGGMTLTRLLECLPMHKLQAILSLDGRLHTRQHGKLHWSCW